MDRSLSVAILAADVVDWQLAVQTDRHGSLTQLRTIAEEIISPATAEHGGRIFKRNGDDFWIVFEASSSALQCALVIQNLMAHAFARTENRLRLRIGLNQGEAVQDSSGDMHGNAVNETARFLSECHPEGVTCSARIRDDARGVVTADFRYRGLVRVKHGLSIEVYDVLPPASYLANRHRDPKLAAFGTYLDVKTPSRILSPEGRRNSFLRPATWSFVWEGAYIERQAIANAAWTRLTNFMDRRRTKKLEDNVLPLFWIGGRSGDGKSVLLLQLARRLLEDADLNKKSEAVSHLLFCKSPDDALSALAAASASEGAPVVIVIDDLHKTTTEDILPLFMDAANTLRDIAILTCGPSPEGRDFRDQVRGTVFFDLWEMPRLTSDDAKVLSRHLGTRIDVADTPGPTLVEQIFLSLGSEASLSIFAGKLRDRVATHGGETDLLVRVVAFTWMDVPFPIDQLDPMGRTRLETLADESQLHFSLETGGTGFRFGHPAIARAMFDALIDPAQQVEPIGVRIGRICGPILAKMPTAFRRMALRQMSSRLPRETNVDLQQFLNDLATTIGSHRLISDIVLFFLVQVNQRGSDRTVAPSWRTLARTLSANKSLERSLRVDLAANLVLLDNPDDKDVRRFLDYSSGADGAKAIGRAFWQLLARRKGGLAFRLIPQACSWARQYPDSKEWPKVVEALFAAYPSDTRIRALGSFLIARAAPDEIGLNVALALAKYMEEESEAFIRTWIENHWKTAAAGSLLGFLLSRSSVGWLPIAVQWLNDNSKSSKVWFSLAASVLRMIDQNDPFVLTMKAFIADRLDKTQVIEIVGVFASRASQLDARGLVLAFLRDIWGEPRALAIFADLWLDLDTIDDEMRFWLNQVGEWAVASPERCDTELIRKAGSALNSISGSRTDPQDWLTACLGFALQDRPDKANASTVGNIAAVIAKVRKTRPTILLDLPTDAILAQAWAYAEMDTKKEVAGRVRCFSALVELDWPTNASRLLEIVFAATRPNLTIFGQYLLKRLLALPSSRPIAIDFIISDVTDSEHRNLGFGRILSTNIEHTFAAYGSLNVRDRNRLASLLAAGIGTPEPERSGIVIPQGNTAHAAWARHGEWPPGLESALWYGILRASIETFSIRRDVFWREFSAWQRRARDPRVAELLRENGLTV